MRSCGRRRQHAALYAGTARWLAVAIHIIGAGHYFQQQRGILYRAGEGPIWSKDEA